MFEEMVIGSTRIGRSERASDRIRVLGGGGDRSSLPVESGKSWDKDVGAHDETKISGKGIESRKFEIIGGAGNGDTNKRVLLTLRKAANLRTQCLG